MKRKFLIVTLLLCKVVLAFGQRELHQIDSLIYAYDQATQGKQKVSVLNEIARCYYLNNPDTAFQIAREALIQSEKIGYTLGKAGALYRMGACYWVKVNHAKSVAYCQQALELFKQEKDLKGIAESLNIIGLSYLNFGDTTRALQSFQENIKKQGDSGRGLNALLNLGGIYYDQQNYDEALTYLAKAYVISKTQQVYLSEVASLNLIGLCLIGKEEYTKGLNKLFYARKILDTLSSQRHLQENTLALAKAYYSMHAYNEAKEFAREGLVLSRQLEDHFGIKSCSDILFHISNQEESPFLAAHYHKVYQQASQRLFELERRNTLESFQANAELVKKKAEIAQHREMNSFQRKINYLCIGLLLLATLLILQVYQQRKKEKLAKDLLEKKNLQNQIQKEEIAKQAKNLTELNATKDKLFAILGHDLRSPIHVLKSWLDLLQNEHLSREEFMEGAEALKMRVDSVYMTLHNLLFWANAQMQGFNTKPEKLSLNALVSENIQLYVDQLQKKHIEIKPLFDKEFTIWADKEQINLVFRNILNNAIKFTPKGGHIVLTGKTKGNYTEVLIRDTGIGISSENLNKLFRKQTYFSTKGSHGEKGTGLGLVLVKEMIDNNQGEIYVESTVGKGTTFVITLLSEPPEDCLEQRPDANVRQNES